MNRLVLIITSLVFLSAKGFSEMPMVPAASPINWVPYQSDTLHFQLKIPSDWTVRESGKAVGFTSVEQPAGGHAAMGILKSTKAMTIEQAAEQQFKKEKRPASWIRKPARFAGARAIKIIGSSIKAPGMKMVQYYVETSDGYFLVQCLAPEDQWEKFSPIFAVMISRFAFTL